MKYYKRTMRIHDNECDYYVKTDKLITVDSVPNATFPISYRNVEQVIARVDAPIDIFGHDYGDTYVLRISVANRTFILKEGEETSLSFTISFEETEMTPYEFQCYPDKVLAYRFMIEKKVKNTQMQLLLRKLVFHNDHFIVNEDGSMVFIGVDFGKNCWVVVGGEYLCVVSLGANRVLFNNADEAYDYLIENDLLSRRSTLERFRTVSSDE